MLTWRRLSAFVRCLVPKDGWVPAGLRRQRPCCPLQLSGALMPPSPCVRRWPRRGTKMPQPRPSSMLPRGEAGPPPSPARKARSTKRRLPAGGPGGGPGPPEAGLGLTLQFSEELPDPSPQHQFRTEHRRPHGVPTDPRTLQGPQLRGSHGSPQVLPGPQCPPSLPSRHRSAAASETDENTGHDLRWAGRGGPGT